MASFLAARRVEGGRCTIWLFGFSNHINHLVQLFCGVPTRVCRNKERKRERKTIYIIGAALCQERINFFLRPLISGKKDNVHTEERQKHTASRQQLCVCVCVCGDEGG